MTIDERLKKAALRYKRERDRLRAENANLRELLRDIEEVADPYLWEYIGRRMGTLGIEVGK